MPEVCLKHVWLCLTRVRNASAQLFDDDSQMELKFGKE